MTTRDPDLCVITCAVSGVLANRKQCPYIPYTPVEIAEECKRAYDAGAAVVHIHARNDDGSPTFSPATFAKIKEETRKRCPIILNFSPGTLEIPAGVKLKGVDLTVSLESLSFFLAQGEADDE